MSNIVQKDIEKIYSLSPLQEGMLYLKENAPDSTQYVIQNVLKISGKHITPEVISQAFDLLACKHDILRTVIFYKGQKKPVQVVLKNKTIDKKIIDLSEYEPSAGKKELQRYVDEDLRRGFDFSRDSYMRVTIIKTWEEQDKLKGKSESYLRMIWTFHHIILDGWSINILKKELAEFLNRLLKGESVEDVKSAIANEKKHPEYQDYISWVTRQPESDGIIFWTNLLADYEAPIHIDSMSDPEEDYSQAVAESYTNLGKELSDKIRGFSDRLTCTVSDVLETAWGVTIAKMLGRKDAVFGKVVSGRNAPVPGIAAMAGLFINTIPTRIKIDGEESIRECILRTQQKAISSSDYDYMTLAKIQSCSTQKSYLFDTIFVYENYGSGNEVLEETGLKIEVDSSREETNYPLSISITDEESFNVRFIYQKKLYVKQDMELIGGYYKRCLEKMVEDDSQPVAEINLITEKEDALVRTGFNGVVTEIASNRSALTYYKEAVLKYPDNRAVSLDGTVLTYKELDCISDWMAKEIILRGAHKGDVVAVQMERTVYYAAALIGIWKAGCVYLPIDPTYPDYYKEFIIKDSGAVFSIGGEKDDIFSNMTEMDENTIGVKFPEVMAADLAYIIYTSGTTGKPKGVKVSHRGLANLYSVFTQRFQVSATDGMLQFANYTFDASIWELVMALMTGACCVMVSKETIENPNRFVEYLVEQQVSVVTLPPAYFLMLPDITLRLVITAGSSTNKEVIEKGLKWGRYINAYGPTETTICASYKEYEKNNGTDLLSIGKPLDNLQIVIADGERFCGRNVVGEILVGGEALAEGYLNRPEENKKAFIHINGKRWYRTGDLGRWIANGEIFYLGRKDKQVKVRGFRIDTGQVEHAIRSINGIEDVIVTAKKKENEDILCAFFISDGEITSQAIRTGLRTKLPSYMIPSVCIRMEAFPTNKSGKVDMRQLPDISFVQKMEAGDTKKGTKLEEQLREIYKEVLGLTNVGLDENFFDLGGQSLKAMSMVNTVKKNLGKNMTVRDLMTYSTPRVLATFLEGASEVTLDPIRKIINRTGKYLQSDAQKRIFIVDQFDEEGLSYNLPMAFEIFGEIDMNKLQRALENMLQRNEILRTGFEVEGDNAYQIVHEEAMPDVEIMDISDMDIESDEERYAHTMEGFVRPFDLDKPPLMRVRVVKCKLSTVLMIDVHHIIADGYTMNLLVKEFNALYNGEELPEPMIQYCDYTEWMRNRDFDQDKRFWKERFANGVPKTELFIGKKMKSRRSYKGDSCTRRLYTGARKDVIEFADRTNATEYMILLAVFSLVISRLSNQEDIVIGTPIACRTRPELENMIGMTLNTLPIKLRAEGNKTFREYLAGVRDYVLKVYDHQEYPLNDIAETLGMDYQTGSSPFDILFILQNNESEQLAFGNMPMRKVEMDDRKISKYDLVLSIRPVADTFEVDFEYSTDIYADEDVNIIAEVFDTFLGRMMGQPDINTELIEMASEQDLFVNIARFNETKAYVPNTKTVADLFERMVYENPDKLAVTTLTGELTYRELYASAMSVALRLNKLGVGAGDMVMLKAKRGIEMIVGLYGIILSGAAYVPVAPDYPKIRIEQIRQDSNSKAVVIWNTTKEDGLENIAVETITGENIDLERLEKVKRNNTKDDLLYILYTSGSTGVPKGVEIMNRSVVNYCWNTEYSIMRDAIDVCGCERFACVTNNTFDIFTTEAIATLLNGKTIVVADETEQKNPLAFLKLMEEKQIDYIQTTPSRIKLWISEKKLMEKFSQIKCLMLGGEKVTSGLISLIGDYVGGNIYNVYGPTETTVWSTSGLIDKNSSEEEISIGTPINNTVVQIMKHGRRCGIGEPGELCIGGLGLAKGYHNLLEKTMAAFVQKDDEIQYRTGDIAYWRRDGSLMYIGRNDTQIKIRGNRIELGEIEKALFYVPGITNAVVIVKEDLNGNNDLFAYVVSSEKVNLSDVRSFLKKKIPLYMIPPYIMQIDAIPMNNSGKLDRSKLPDIKFITQTAYVAPTSKLEKKLVKIITTIAGIPNLGIDDDIMEYGINSIDALKIVSKASAQNIKLNVQTLFDYPTVREMVSRVQQKNEEDYEVDESEEYRNCNVIVKDNHITADYHVKERKMKSVLVTGATGFLGSHVVRELLKDPEKVVYCAVRGSTTANCRKRLGEILSFYFPEEKLIDLPGIRTIKYDPNVEEDKENLPTDVDTVIHVAASTNHYGNREKFLVSNVGFTEKMLSYAKEVHAMFCYVSTTSVQGLMRFNSEKQKYTERDFYIGQIFISPYAKSKFMAEKLVLEARKDYEDAFIVRVGNLTNRYTDGVTMKNPNSNYFLELLGAVINLGVVSTELMEDTIEMSPIDETAEGLVQICSHYDSKFSVFHLNNDKRVLLSRIFEELKKKGIIIKKVPDIVLAFKLNHALHGDDNRRKIYEVLRRNDVYDFKENLVLFDTDSSFTNQFLKKCGFEWKYNDDTYLKKFIDMNLSRKIWKGVRSK